jgi:hypothetical protein
MTPLGTGDLEEPRPGHFYVNPRGRLAHEAEAEALWSFIHSLHCPVTENILGNGLLSLFPEPEPHQE